MARTVAFRGGRGSRIFRASASVQSDKSAEAMTEMAALLKSAVTDRKIDAKELATTRDNMTPRPVEQLVDQAMASRNISPTRSRTGCPTIITAITRRMSSATTLDAVNAAGTALLANRPLTWLVVGDRAKIEARIRALGLGEVRIDRRRRQSRSLIRFHAPWPARRAGRNPRP